MNAQLNAERVDDSAAQPQPPAQPRVQSRPAEEPAHCWPEPPAPASPRLAATRNEITFFGAPDASGVSEVASIAVITSDTIASTGVTVAPKTVQSTSSENNPDDLPPLVHAAQRGDLAEVKALLAASKADIQQLVAEHGASALSLAAGKGYSAIVGALIAAGTDPNCCALDEGDTALMIAAAMGHRDVVELLLKVPNIDLDRINEDGDNALILAACDNEVDIVNCLIRAGANVNYIGLSNREDLTPLMWATINDSTEAAGALLAHDDIEVDIVNGKGKTALYMAATCGVSTAMIDRLLAAGAQLNVAHPRNGSTPLMVATQAGWAEIVRLLLGVPGIDIPTTDFSRRSRRLLRLPGKPPSLRCRARAARYLPASPWCRPSRSYARKQSGMRRSSLLCRYRTSSRRGIACRCCRLCWAAATTKICMRCSRTVRPIAAILRAVAGARNVAGRLAARPRGVGKTYVENQPSTHESIMQPISLPGSSTAQFDDEHELQPEPASRLRPLIYTGEARSRAQLGVSTNFSMPYPRPENTADSAALSTASTVRFIDEASDRSPLLRAARDNDLARLAALLGAGQDVNYYDPATHTTALIYAAEKGHAEAVALLLAQEGIDIERTDRSGETALRAAVSMLATPVVSLLLQAGASSAIFSKDEFGVAVFKLVPISASLTEIFLEHGVPVDPGEVDLLSSDESRHAAAVADLCAAYKTSTPHPFAPGVMLALAGILSLRLGSSEMERAIFKRLRGEGMRAAPALLVLTVLKQAEASRVAQSGSAAQATTLYLSALSWLRALTDDRNTLDYYRSCDIGEPGVERLGAVAIAQLDELAALATDHLATVGADMLDGLQDNCAASTSIDGVVAASVLPARLCDSGFCAPVANAVTLGRQCAVAAVREALTISADGVAPESSTVAWQRRVVLNAQAIFPRELLRQLGARDRLAELRVAADGAGGGVAQAQYQIQCDWLRQYCDQQMHDLPTSTSSTSSTFQQ